MIIITCSAALGALLKPNSSNGLIVAVITLSVAILALLISLRTFISIDEVNAISRMDGNVMENPRFRPNVLHFVFRFKQPEFDNSSEAVMSYMETLFLPSHNLSGAHIADNVQEVADMMVLIPFFIQTAIEQESSINLSRVTSLIKKMQHYVNNLKDVSDRSCKLLDETVKLVESVFYYQEMSAYGKSDPSKLLEIRGSLFINPVSCILYNNYLGLYFLHRAIGVISNFQNNLSINQQIDLAVACPREKKAIALIYAKKASVLFKKTKDFIGEDIIWKAFVFFNLARAEYLVHILLKEINGEMSYSWEQNINESLQCWTTANMVIEEHLGSSRYSETSSWLQKAILSQENKVRLSKVIFQMKINVPLTDMNGDLWTENYQEFLNSTFFKNLPSKDPLKRTDSLINDIKLLIKEEQ